MALTSFLVVGAGAAGLMAARELAAAGKAVTIVEARDRCGGRIESLPVEQFGYAAEGGAEFVHGAAVVTRAVMREAGLSLAPRVGTRWSTRSGALSLDEPATPHWDRFYRVLSQVTADLPIAEFLERHFAAPRYASLRRAVVRTVEGYDAADPARFSTLALREEWMSREEGEHGRLRDGYGALIDYLAGECRRHGATLRLGAALAAIDQANGGIVARCRDGAVIAADAAVVTVPLPLLSDIAWPAAARARIAAAADIGFGNVVKLLLRFKTHWWAALRGPDLVDLAFVLSEAAVPTWWTQFPAAHPLLTGWFAGPRAERALSRSEAEFIELGLVSLGEVFGVSRDLLDSELVTARAINWGQDPFARGAYSYATPKSRAAQAVLKNPAGSGIFIAGEALYAGPDMGTVEAALASGLETAQTILATGA